MTISSLFPSCMSNAHEDQFWCVCPRWPLVTGSHRRRLGRHSLGSSVALCTRRKDALPLGYTALSSLEQLASWLNLANLANTSCPASEPG